MPPSSVQELDELIFGQKNRPDKSVPIRTVSDLDRILEQKPSPSFLDYFTDITTQAPIGIAQGIIDIPVGLGMLASRGLQEVTPTDWWTEGERTPEERARVFEDIYESTRLPEARTEPGRQVRGIAEFLAPAVVPGAKVATSLGAGVRAIRLATEAPKIARAAERVLGGAGAWTTASLLKNLPALEAGKITPEEYWKEAEVSAVTGGAMGGAGLASTPLRRVIGEVGALTFVPPAIAEQRFPTLQEAVYATVTLGGFKGLQVGMNYLAGARGVPKEQIQGEIFAKAKAENRTPKQALMEDLEKLRKEPIAPLPEGKEMPRAETQGPQGQEVLRPAPPPSALGIEPQPGTTELPGATPKVEPKGYGATALPQGEGVVPSGALPIVATATTRRNHFVKRGKEWYADIYQEQSGWTERRVTDSSKKLYLEKIKMPLSEPKGYGATALPQGEGVVRELLQKVMAGKISYTKARKEAVSLGLEKEYLKLKSEYAEQRKVKPEDLLAERMENNRLLEEAKTRTPQDKTITAKNPYGNRYFDVVGRDWLIFTREQRTEFIKNDVRERIEEIQSIKEGKAEEEATLAEMQGIEERNLAKTEEISNYAQSKGLSAEISGFYDSKYIYIKDAAEDTVATIRISSHAQPAGGGFSVEKQAKHGEADLSIDPSSKTTMQDAKELINTIATKREGITTQIIKDSETPAEKLERDKQDFIERQGEMGGVGIPPEPPKAVEGRFMNISEKAKFLAEEAYGKVPKTTLGWDATDGLAKILSFKEAQATAKKMSEGQLTATMTRLLQELATVAEKQAESPKLPDLSIPANRGKVSTEQLIEEIKNMVAPVQNVMESAKPLGSEIGRALQGLKKFIQIIEGIKDIETITDREKLLTILERFQKLPPGNLNAYIQFVKSMKEPKFMDYIYEYWYNSILSGPTTYLVNNINNTTWQAYQVPHRTVRGTVDLALSKITGKPREFYAREGWIAFKVGYKSGFARLAELIRTRQFGDDSTKWARESGSTFEAFSRSPNAFLRKIAPIISFPTRALRAADIFAKSVAGDIEIATQAYRKGRKLGLQGEALTTKVADLIQNPTTDMLAAAGKFADYATFNDAPGKISTAIMQFRNVVPGGRFIIPFVTTIGNLMKRGVEMTPGAGAVLLRKELAGPQRADAITKQLMGGAIAYLAFQYIDGLLTGAVPSDKAEREAFYRQGKLPWAININGTWVQYRRFEPFNTVLASVALLGDTWRDKGKAPTTEQILSVFTGLGKNLLDASYVGGLADLISAIERGDQSAESIRKMAQRQITSFAPFSSLQRSLIRGTEAIQTGEAVVRKPTTLKEAFQAQMPGLSGRVPGKKDVFSKTVTLPGGAIRQWLPFKASPSTTDKVELELQRLGIFPGEVPKKISGLTLSEDEHNRYAGLFGRTSKDLLNRVMASPGWDRLDDKGKTQWVDYILRTSREAARQRVLGEKITRLKQTGVPPEVGREINRLGLHKKAP